MSNEKESELDGEEMSPYRRFWECDGAGQEINSGWSINLEDRLDLTSGALPQR
jgi:hypothetical protein